MSERLHPAEASPLHARRERVFLVLAGTFLGAMAMLNILGITKFIQLGPFALAVGVLPYPLTFLCTDLICELYGRARANFVVFTGLLVNLLVLGFVWAGDAAPSMAFRTPLQRIVTLDYVGETDAKGDPIVDPATGHPLVRPAVPERTSAGATVLRPVERFALAPLPGGPPGTQRLVDADTGQPVLREESLFGRLAASTRQAVLASMIAYLFAQFVDIWLFHFWKRVTRGRHLWLRNNGSTVVSQLVDTVCVVFVTFWASLMAGAITLAELLALIGGGYAFKLVMALADTLPFYLAVGKLSRYLQIDPARDA
ncbi:MAG: queuosine precursor transporter [Myxococcota bacterium]|nr:queuosine precursor transporter [Myxococcota bacterium]MDP6242315.1 queuosine precursor transporter [Myxococcota bacterium]MDP7076436.1 queuosine precursor transporter [Myxococcota bacterium]MDP7298023.1 queuosine precursor transporter [Myxococcota bacterium]MDP7431659.1 queuosine precursor transporter [Myxococcota bacterium]